MNAKTIIPLVVAIVFAVVAAKLGKDFMSKGKNSGTQVKMTKVLVAREDIPPGATIKEADVLLRELPTEGLPQYTFSQAADVVGRVVMAQMVKGQAVLETMLAPKGSSGGAQAMIPDGMRAVTIEVNEFSGVAGLLVPGCKVDMVQTIRSGEKSGEGDMVSKTVVENLRVIAVGRRVSTVGPEPEQLARSVTVLATQEQAETIDLVTHMGSPRLVLRNSLDNRVNGGKGVTLAELRGSSKETESISDVVARLLANSATTRPIEQPKVEAPKTETVKTIENNDRYREVEVIRAGSSTSIKLQLAPLGPLTAGGHELKSVGKE